MSWLLKFLGKVTIGEIADKLTDAYKARLEAKNDHERLEAEKEIARLEAHQSILIAEQGSWMTRWIRPAFAIPFIIYNFKIVVYDKVLGLGSTDSLSPEFWQLQMVVFGAYFLTRALEKR